MKIIALIIFLILNSLSSHAFFNKTNISKNKIAGGAMDGGGSGSSYPEAGAAWFYRDNPKGYISVCIERENNFKASLKTIEKLIIKSFSTWNRYIDQAGIHKGVYYDNQNKPIPFPEFLKILSKVRIEACSKTTEITFYFGTVNKEIQTVLDRMVLPKAFAYRSYKDIDSLKGTSKGMVWIINPENTDNPILKRSYDWSDSDKLQAMINHEVGHVMGVQHIQDTIMRSDLSHLFSSVSSTTPQDSSNRKKLNKIDHELRVLFPEKESILNGSMGLPNSTSESDTFKLFMGRLPEGDVKVDFLIKENYKYEIRISDSKTSEKFQLSLNNSDFSSFSLHDSEIFKRYRREIEIFPDGGTAEFGHHYSSSKSNTFFSTKIELNSKKMILDFNYNPGFTQFMLDGKLNRTNNPLTIFYIHNNEKLPLFIKEPIAMNQEVK